MKKRVLSLVLALVLCLILLSAAKSSSFSSSVIEVANNSLLKLIDSDPTAVHYFTEGTDGRWSLCGVRWRSACQCSLPITLGGDSSKTVTIANNKDLGGNDRNILLNDTNNALSGGASVKAKFTAKQSASFVDVPKSAYFFDAVNWAVENDITSGVDETHFDPNGSCTRAQLVTFLWRAMGCSEPKAGSGFADVSGSAYYAKAVALAVENGITNGLDEKNFGPEENCTRAQIVTFIYRALAD